MEGNKILDTASGLHTVNELLKKYVREQALSHEEKRDLWLFYKEFKDTNTLIDFAETVAHEKEHAGTDSVLIYKEKRGKMEHINNNCQF